MRIVVSSTAEAQYHVLSEVVKEFKFIIQLLQTMRIQVEIPITVYVVNVGAIWLSNNCTTSERAKHVHIPLQTPLIDPNWINSKLMIALVNNFFYLTQNS